MDKLKFDKNRKRVKYCPCGKSNRDGKFSPFVDYENKGKCHSCGELFLPEQDGAAYTPVFHKPKQTDYLDAELITQHGRNFKENNFVQFLKERFGQQAAETAILTYSLGTSDKWPGATIFWQVDAQGRVRTGKIMLYNPQTGESIKEPYRHVSWVHSEGFSLKQCLFGLHLTAREKPAKIAVTESEKTAIIMALTYPEVTWMATGGKGNFRRELLHPIREYEIIAYPDKGEYAIWQAMAGELNREGYNIRVDDTLENLPYPKGTDFADVVLSRVYSQAEIQVKKLAAINPAILMLIEEFGLVDEQNNPINIA